MGSSPTPKNGSSSIRSWRSSAPSWDFKNQGAPRAGAGEGSTAGLCRYLLVNAHGVQPVVHDVHPAILGGEHKQGHQGLEKGHKRLVVGPHKPWVFEFSVFSDTDPLENIFDLRPWII